MSRTKLLRIALAANAAFSFSSGTVMLTAPSFVSSLTGQSSDLIFQAIGAGLILFALELIYQATRPRMQTWRALLASIADFGWVLGSLVLVIPALGLFSATGTLVVLSVAAIVMLFGTAQLIGIAMAHGTDRPGRYRHCMVIETSATPDEIWPAIEDMGAIHRYSPMLKNSTLVNDDVAAVGTVRACENHQGQKWSEECITLIPKSTLHLRFNADEPGFPFPVKEMEGCWEVSPTSRGTEVTIWWELTPNNPLLAPLLLPILAFQADRDFPKVIDRMAKEYSTFSVNAETNGRKSFLIPRFC